MTIGGAPRIAAKHPRISPDPLTKLKREPRNIAPLQRRAETTRFMTSMNDNRYSGASEAELGFLKEIVRMLPAGLTVQDAQGELLLVNDAAASQLGMDGSRPSPDLAPRREACQQALMSGQPVISEEALHDGAARQV